MLIKGIFEETLGHDNKMIIEVIVTFLLLSQVVQSCNASPCKLRE